MVPLTRQELDICDERAVAVALARLRPSAVVNAAVVNGVDAIERDPARAHPVNAVAPGVLARACAAAGVPLVHVSTDYVFGGRPGGPWKETDAPAPVNAYGAMKAEGEARALSQGGKVCVARVAWLFGDGACFVAAMLEEGLREGRVRLVADQVGSPTPIDAVAARLIQLADLMAEGDPRVPPILHLAGGPPVTRPAWIGEAVAEIAAAGGPAVGVEVAAQQDRPGSAPRPSFSALDVSLAEKLFGWRLPWTEATRALGRASVRNVGLRRADGEVFGGCA